MVALSLKICVRHCNVVKTMQFEPSTAVYDACRVIRERVPEAQTGQGRSLAIGWLLEMCSYVFPLEARETEPLSGTQAHWYVYFKCFIFSWTFLTSCVRLIVRLVITVPTTATEPLSWSSSSSSWPFHRSASCSAGYKSLFAIKPCSKDKAALINTILNIMNPVAYAWKLSTASSLKIGTAIRTQGKPHISHTLQGSLIFILNLKKKKMWYRSSHCGLVT